MISLLKIASLLWSGGLVVTPIVVGIDVYKTYESKSEKSLEKKANFSSTYNSTSQDLLNVTLNNPNITNKSNPWIDIPSNSVLGNINNAYYYSLVNSYDRGSSLIHNGIYKMIKFNNHINGLTLDRLFLNSNLYNSINVQNVQVNPFYIYDIYYSTQNWIYFGECKTFYVNGVFPTTKSVESLTSNQKILISSIDPSKRYFTWYNPNGAGDIGFGITLSSDKYTIEGKNLNFNYYQNIDFINLVHVSGSTHTFKVALMIQPIKVKSFDYTLPYSVDQIRYDLFESSNRIFEDKISFTSNDSLDPFEDINNFNNVQTLTNNMVNNFISYLNSSDDIANMGANASMFTTSIDYNSLKNNDPEVIIKIALSNEISKLIPIQEDLINPNLYSANNNYVKVINNEITINIPVEILPGSNFNGSLSELLNIIPYNSLNNTIMYYDKSKEYNPGECLILTSKNTNFNLSNPGIVNINDNYQLLTENKIGFINKYGAEVTLDFDLEVNGTIYNLSTIQLSKFYKYGSYDFEINLPISNSNLVQNNIIKLKFIYNSSGINIVSSGLNNLVSANPNINLYLRKINIKVANDQNYGLSSWIKISNSPIDVNDKNFANNENISKFFGHYSTNSPFKITVPEILVQSVDDSQSLISKYKLFINDQAISSEPNKGYSYDTGNIYRDAMNSNSTEIAQEIKIRIYEYDPVSQDTNKYSKIAFGLDVSMNVLKEVSNFNLKGWSDPSIESEKEKYFDDESDSYRPYANQDTGMYFPKVAWVNAPANYGFKYDPIDEDGNLLDGLSANNSDGNIDVDYKTGFLAEINASSFKSGDFTSTNLTGAYDIGYSNDNFDFTSNLPVVYEYIFSNNNYNSSPTINETLLFKDDRVEINSSNLTQTILKRTKSEDYTYQFSIFNKNIINPSTNEQYDLFQLYSSYVNMNNEPLFVDFWQTYHGDNLLKFIQTSQPNFNLESAYELSYLETLSYWDSYIFAKTSSLTINSLNNYNGINTLNYICEDRYKLKQLIIDDIQAKLQEWYQNNVSRELIFLGKDYYIDDFDGNLSTSSPQFDSKIDTLIKNFENNNLSYVQFTITGISNSKLSDSTTFRVANYANFDTLDNLYPITVRFNSAFSGDKENNKPSFDETYEGNSKQEKIKNLILSSIDKEIDTKFNKNYIYEIDYKLSFYSNIKCEPEYQYSNITEAINKGLLNNISNGNFKNSLFVKIEGITSNLDDPNKILTGSNIKTFINDSSLNSASEENDIVKNNSNSVKPEDLIWILSLSIALGLLLIIAITILVLRHKRKRI